MKEDGAPFDSGFDDTGPFRVSPETGGVSLESALREFGPAAIDDLIPRVCAVARILDAAHDAGVVHGALHPSYVFVTDDATSVIAGKGARAPYAAPEVVDGYGASAKADQFALAAVAYEWMFGRPIPHVGDRPIEVRSMPGVDRTALSRAYTRALSPDPDDRFPTCVAFCDALSGAVVPELPLLAAADDFPSEDQLAGAPLNPGDRDSDRDIVLGVPAPTVDDVKIVAEESIMTAASFDAERNSAFLAQDRQPDLDAIDPRISAPSPAPVPSWNPAATSLPRPIEPQRFGPIALFLAVIVGAVFGFAAGYMARPRALQSSAPQQIAVAPGTDAPIKAPEAQKAPEAPGPKAREAPKVPEAPKNVGRLLVRSSPSGASVSVDGVAKGITPLALRDLDVGTRTVTLARRGYISETRKVVITKARPARTLEVRLSSEPVAAPKPSTPASIGRPAVKTGTLSVESRPSGATVTIDGKASGTTPLTINDLAPGDYRIELAMPGYRNFATTVRVVAGERARAAASLTALEQQ